MRHNLLRCRLILCSFFLMLCLIGCSAGAPFSQITLEKAVVQRMSTQGSAEFTDEDVLRRIETQLARLKPGRVCDTPSEDPTMMLVLYEKNGDVHTLLTYGAYLEIDGTAYHAEKETCLSINVMLWQLLYP